MDVTEQAEEQSAEAEVLTGAPAVIQAPAGVIPAPIVHPPPPPLPPPPMPHRTWLRLAYVVEFWIALIAIFIVWSQVGGQAHLDLMAWYFKLICGVAMALSAVGMTRAMVEKQRAWNAAAFMWLLAILVLATLMSYITYWYHLHEQDDQQTDDNTATWVGNRNAERDFARVVVERVGKD